MARKPDPIMKIGKPVAQAMFDAGFPFEHVERVICTQLGVRLALVMSAEDANRCVAREFAIVERNRP